MSAIDASDGLLLGREFDQRYFDIKRGDGEGNARG